jgi:hypothetical protein
VDSVEGFCVKLRHYRSAPFFGGVTATVTLITGCGIERSESFLSALSRSEEILSLR